MRGEERMEKGRLRKGKWGSGLGKGHGKWARRWRKGGKRVRSLRGGCVKVKGKRPFKRLRSREKTVGKERRTRV